MRDGIDLHRAIDVFTDSHDEVLAARELLPAPFRRYAGILLDMWFDHCLARDFDAGLPVPSQSTPTRLRWAYDAAEAILRFAQSVSSVTWTANDLPAGYAEPEARQCAARDLPRLSRANPVAEAMPLLVSEDAMLQRHVRAFFPAVQGLRAREWVRAASAA